MKTAVPTRQGTDRVQRALQWSSNSSLARFVAIFVVLIVLKAPELALPTSYDASWSLIPAAQTLAETNFDYPALLDLPGFREFGPSTHAVSLATPFTALVFWILGTGTVALITLHLLHLALGAWALVSLYHLARRVVGRGAVFIPIVALATPIVFTQFGFVYLEIPLLAFTLASAVAWSEGRDMRAIGFALAATAVKASGFVAIATLAALMVRRRRPHDVRKAALTVGSGLVALLPTLAGGENITGNALDPSRISEYWSTHLEFLRIAPFTILIALGFLAAAVWWVLAAADESRNDALAFAAVFPTLFVGFHFIGPVFGQAVNFLPRYWVVPLPLMLLLIAGAVHAVASRRACAGIAAGYVLVAVLGLFGFLLPYRSTANFLMAERSPAHTDLVRVLDRAIDELAAHEAVPLVGRNTWFRMAYPANGYVSHPVEDMVTFDKDLDLPRHFVAIDRGVREPIIDRIDDLGPEWTVTSTALSEGPFTIRLLEVERLP